MSNDLKNLVRPLTGYTQPEKHALDLLADLALADGTVYISSDVLARYMNCCERTARRALHSLEEKGNLASLQNKVGRGRIHWYRVIGKPPVKKSPVKKPSVADVLVEDVPVAPPSSNGRKGVHHAASRKK